MNVVPFGVEEWLNVWEKKAVYDIAQSTVASFTLEELLGIDSKTTVESFFAERAGVPLNYGWIEGSPEFKELTAARYRRFDPGMILQTNGGTGANLLAGMGLIEKGDHVIAFYPSYQQLYDLPRSLGAEVSLLELREAQGWNPDPDELASLIKPNTKVIALNNANNPTGTVIEEDLMLVIADIARKAGAYLWVDEVFQSLDPSVRMTPVVDLYEKGISTNSISKTYSAPGIRIGWTAAPPEVTEKFRSLRDYTMICAGVLDDALAVHILRNAEAVLERNRRLVTRNLKTLRDWVEGEPRVSVVLPKAVSVSFIRLDIEQDVESFCIDLLRETGVLLAPGTCFGISGHARLGYRTHTETLVRGLEALSNYLRKIQ